MSESDRLTELQEMLLPARLPEIGCTEAAAVYRAHNGSIRLGGDWYDLIDVHDENRIVAIMGDVAGHGLLQVSVMGQLRAASNALARTCRQPHELLSALDAFGRTLPGAQLTTLAVLAMDGTTTAHLASAGHLPSLHIRSGGEVQVIDGGSGPALAVDGPPMSSTTFTYAVDDLLVLYTDGVVERRGFDLDEQIAALGAFVQERFDEPCREIASAILDEFVHEQADDMAAMVLRPLHHRRQDYELSRRYEPSVVGSKP